MFSHLTGAKIMKPSDFYKQRGVVISVFIVLLTLALVGTVAAFGPRDGGLCNVGNGTALGPHYQNCTAGNGTGDRDEMMQQSWTDRGSTGARAGMPGAMIGSRGGAGTMMGAGVLPVAAMGIMALLGGLLIVVWLIVGILLSVFLYRKLRQEPPQ
jgi:hypothetical protein